MTQFYYIKSMESILGECMFFNSTWLSDPSIAYYLWKKKRKETKQNARFLFLKIINFYTKNGIKILYD